LNFQIINNQGTFEIHGNLTSKNASYTKEYFNTLLDRYYEVVICLNKVTKLDNSALQVLRFISKKAKQRSKILFVLGKNNRKIKSAIQRANLNSIFRNDY